jgi:serine/threonine protein kinase
MIADDATMSGEDLRPMANAPRKLALGSRFAGRYDIETLLGEGGMGAVYRVRDLALAESVALKVLTLPTGGTRDHAEMFRQEVKLSRRITHANVVHVYDIGEVDSLLYMTMELVDGITLRRAMQNSPEGKLPLAEAIGIAHALANGLAAVHAQGIVHRDLKPGNVMIAKSGRVVLADFGIASQVDTDDPAMHGRIIGTISYMAPEQFAKQAPSPRTDLYSFGLVLLECLTGSLPPRTDGWLSSHRKPVHVDLAAVGVVGKPVEIAAVERLIRQCLDNDPAARPASAEAVSRDLNVLRSHKQSRTDIGVYSLDRTNTNSSFGAQLSAMHVPENLQDRTTIEVADIVALGIPSDIAQDYVTARHESRLNDSSHLVGAYERFDSCVQRAPYFHRAIASRAVLAVRCWFFDKISSTEINWAEASVEAVDAALRLAPELSDTHLAAGMLATQRFEMKQAMRSLVRAVEIDPASHEAQEYLGGIEIETGLVARGVARVVYGATALPPRPIACMILARCYALLGRFDESDPQLIEANRRSSIPTLGGLLYCIRLHAYRWGKRPVSLTISQRKAIRENNWVGVTHYLDVLAGTGDSAKIVAWIDSFLPKVSNPRAGMVLRQLCIEIYMLLELDTKALLLLADCARNGLIDILWVDRCPLLLRMRSMEGFGEVRDWVWLNAYGVWN